MDQTISTLLGTVLGAVLSFAAVYGNQRLQRLRQRRAARMRVANDLRHWLSRIASNLSDTITSVDSQGAGGKVYCELPDFRFEESLELIARLERKTSEKIFELIHEKDEANTAIDVIYEYQDSDDAIDEFRERSAKLFLATLGIYRRVCQQIKWSPKTFADWHEPMMRKEIDRMDQIHKKRASFNRAFFADGVVEQTATEQVS